MARCKFCEWGEDNSYLFYRQKGVGALNACLTCFIGSTETLFISADIGERGSEGELISTSKKIKYCPMCGRKLQKGETNG